MLKMCGYMVILFCILHLVNSQDTTTWNGNEYFYDQRARHWEQARSLCQSKWSDGKGELVTIDNKDENDFLNNELIAKNGNKMTWIGANDIEQPLDLRWSLDNSVVKYVNWGKNQPASTPYKESCVGFDLGGWKKLECGKYFPSICERKIPLPPPPPPPPRPREQLTFVRFYSNEYCYDRASRTWEEARKVCQKLWGGKGDLVTINEDIENDVLAYILALPGWIGANAKVKPSDFRWAADNSALTYAKWKVNEPDNSGNLKRCVYYHKFLWSTDNCESKRPYFCEKKK